MANLHNETPRHLFGVGYIEPGHRVNMEGFVGHIMVSDESGLGFRV